jgi:hypothetical protein
MHRKFALILGSALLAADFALSGPAFAQEQKPAPAMTPQHDQGMMSADMMARMNKMMDRCEKMMDGHDTQHGMRHHKEG